MHKWKVIIVFSFLLGIESFSILTVMSAETGTDSIWKLSIAAPKADRVLSITLDSTEHFHVVLENISKVSKKFWKDSNSWGYSVLTFEITDKSGAKSIIRKRPRNWRKNFPGFWEIGQGEQVIYNISLTNGEWDFFIHKGSKGKLFEIQAIIDVPDDNKAREFGVWTGQIKSPVYEVYFVGDSIGPIPSGAEASHKVFRKEFSSWDKWGQRKMK